MYLTDIRIMISTKDFNKINFSIKPVSCISKEKITMATWLNLETKEKEDIITTLYDSEVTFRALALGENPNDISDEYYDSEDEEELDIPYPSLLRDFDDKEDLNNIY